MEFPLWAVFGLTAASLSALVMLIQERYRIDGFAMAFWNKAGCAVFMLIPVLYFGLPDSPLFYGVLILQSLLWVVSDVIFFSAIPKVGAGVVSRILPVSIILTFFLWFAFDPGLLVKYLSEPLRSTLLVATLFASVYFATRLKKCPVSWEAVRLLWFVIFSCVASPIMTKIISQHTTIEKGPFAYVFCQAIFMISCWLLWYAVRRPIPREILFSKNAAKAGFAVGAISSLAVAADFMAVFHVDNPGLVPAIKFTDTIIIIGVYKLIGRRETADVVSGLGIVACAGVIIFLKAWQF